MHSNTEDVLIHNMSQTWEPLKTDPIFNTTGGRTNPHIQCPTPNPLGDDHHKSKPRWGPSTRTTLNPTLNPFGENPNSKPKGAGNIKTPHNPTLRPFGRNTHIYTPSEGGWRTKHQIIKPWAPPLCPQHKGARQAQTNQNPTLGPVDATTQHTPQ